VIDIEPFSLDPKPEATAEQLRAHADGMRAALELFNAEHDAMKVLDPTVSVEVSWQTGWKTGLQKRGYWEVFIERTTEL
jgi:hypothetical protein